MPLYLVDGTKISAGNLWSGALLYPINVDINGTIQANEYVWTATDYDGTSHSTGMGLMYVYTGNTNHINT